MTENITKIKSLARAYTEKAIETLGGIMSQPSSPEAARVAAANALLDRGWGKPTQPLGGDKENPLVFTRLEDVIVDPRGDTQDGSAEGIRHASEAS